LKTSSDLEANCYGFASGRRKFIFPFYKVLQA